MIFFLFDILVIILHLKFGQYRLFNLDGENNFPTLYQGFKLFLISTACLVPLITAYINKLSIRRLLSIWLPLYVVFTWLAIDELAQFHENSKQFLEDFYPQLASHYTGFFTSQGYGSTEWVLMYLPLFIIFFLYALFVARSFVQKYGFRICIPTIAGIGMYAGVILLEVIGMDKIVRFDYGKIILLEESFEMIGTSLIGVTILTIAIIDFRNARTSSDVNINKSKYKLSRRAVSFLSLCLVGFIGIAGFKLLQPAAETQQTMNIPENTITREPSRVAREGCAWKDEIRPELGIKFFFEDCGNESNLLTKTNILYALPEVILAEKKINEYRQIEIFTKPDDQPIQDSIYVHFIDTLTQEQKTACKVIKEDYQLHGNDVYRIFPDLEYTKNSHIAQYISCGEFSITASNGFFLFDPNKKQKYLYVYEDQDLSVIDKDTIELL